jgi:hypothetical protein
MCSTAKRFDRGHDPSGMRSTGPHAGERIAQTIRAIAGCDGPGQLDWLLLWVGATGSGQRYGLRGHLRDGVLLAGRVNTDDHRPRSRTTFRGGPPIWETAGLLLLFYVSIDQKFARTCTLQTFVK